MEWNYTPKCLIISIRDVGMQSRKRVLQGSTLPASRTGKRRVTLMNNGNARAENQRIVGNLEVIAGL